MAASAAAHIQTHDIAEPESESNDGESLKDSLLALLSALAT